MNVTKLVIRSKGLIHLVDFSNIVYCQSDNCYITIYFSDETSMLIIKSLIQLEKELDPNIFLRTNQSFIVNKFFITMIDKKHKAIHLKNGKILPYTLDIKKIVEHVVYADNSIDSINKQV